MKTSLIIPAWNEEKALPLVIDEALKFVDEIVVVDDGSKDRTYDIGKRYSKKFRKVKIIRHKKNSGKVAAIRTGIKNSTGDIIILTDADFTYPARYIPKFVSEIKKGADLVLGDRVSLGLRNIPLFNRIGNLLFSFLISYVGCSEIKDGQTGFRAFRKNKFKELDVCAKSLEFETKMTTRASKLGYKILEIPIEYRERVGKSKLHPLRDGYRMLRALFSIAISETSLIAKTIMFPSIFLIIAALFFGIISIIEAVAWYQYGIPSKHKYYPLLTALSIFVSIQLISLGLVIDHLTKKIDRVIERLK